MKKAAKSAAAIAAEEEKKTITVDVPEVTFAPAAISTSHPIDWHQYIDYSVPNTFKRWTDPTGVKEGLVISLVCGKYKQWSAFFYLDRVKREWRPATATQPWLSKITGMDYEKLLKIYDAC